MNRDKLTLEPDEDDRAIWLVTETHGIRQKEIVWLRDGFGLDDVREAILATGWVKQEGDEFCFTSAGKGLAGKVMSNMIEEMFTYFSAPGVPTNELLEVQSAVSEYECMRENSLGISVYAYAWLDLMVREDIADDARSAKDIWAKSKIVIEVDRCCDRRVEELISRYSPLATRTISRMSGSIPTRNHDASRDTKTG